MALPEWLKFPRELGEKGWSFRGDFEIQRIIDVLNRIKPDGYLWESETSAEEILVQGEQGASNNRVRFQVTTDGGGTEGFEIWVNGVRALFIGDNNIYLYSDDGGTELIGVDRVNDRVDLIADAAVTLGTSITNFGGSWLGGNYRVDNSGQVTLEGLLRNSTGGNITNPYTIASISSTYAPQGDILFLQKDGSTDGFARVAVTTAGSIIFQGADALPNNQFISLSGMSWYYI